MIFIFEKQHQFSFKPSKKNVNSMTKESGI